MVTLAFHSRNRHLMLTRCPRCRRSTPHERVLRLVAIPLGMLLSHTLVDPGYHCYSCGYDWGFGLPRRRSEQIHWVPLTSEVGGR